MAAPRIASLGLIGALAISPLVASSAFAAAPHAGHPQHPAVSHPGKVHTAKTQHANHGRRVTPFSANGVVTAVDPVAGTLTLADKGGSRDLHGSTVTLSVPAAASVEVNTVAASLGDVTVGDHVAANGLRSTGPLFTARHVNAETADPGSTDPTDPVDAGAPAAP